jgi:hypothetical protein
MEIGLLESSADKLFPSSLERLKLKRSFRKTRDDSQRGSPLPLRDTLSNVPLSA